MKIFTYLAVTAVGATLLQMMPIARAQAQTEPKPLPPITIVLVGDSTVASGGGWGSEFAKLLAPEAHCVNLAVGGRSSKSYWDEGRWNKVVEQKPNYVFIQFGHNDMPGKGPARETDPNTTYSQNLKHYIEEARALGAKPILVTPLTRRFFREGQIKSDLVAYAQAATQVAKDNDVPLVDLHARSIEQLNAMGKPAALKYDRPGADPTQHDKTHLSDVGAQATAVLVAREVQTVEPELGKYITLPVPPAEPAQP
jgi:lysophospholipase L1-like esterase